MIAYLRFTFDNSPNAYWVMYHNNEFWINYLKQTSSLEDKHVIFKLKQPPGNKVTDEDALFNLIFTTKRANGIITLLCDEEIIHESCFNNCIEKKRETREFFDKMCPLLKHICNSEDDVEQLNSSNLPKEILNMITKLTN